MKSSKNTDYALVSVIALFVLLIIWQFIRPESAPTFADVLGLSGLAVAIWKVVAAEKAAKRALDQQHDQAQALERFKQEHAQALERFKQEHEARMKELELTHKAKFEDWKSALRVEEPLREEVIKSTRAAYVALMQANNKIGDYRHRQSFDKDEMDDGIVYSIIGLSSDIYDLLKDMRDQNPLLPVEVRNDVFKVMEVFAPLKFAQSEEAAVDEGAAISGADALAAMLLRLERILRVLSANFAQVAEQEGVEG